MKNEQKLWKNILSNILAICNPKGLTAPAIAPGVEAAPGANAFIYVLDAQTGWITMGSISSVSFLELHRKSAADFAKSKADRDEMLDLAINKIIHCSRGQSTDDSHRSIGAIVAASCALASTNTCAAIRKSTGKVSGHWLYIVYSTHKNTLIGRPAYAAGSANAFMGSSQLNSLITKTIRLDIDHPDTSVGLVGSVGQQLINSGGAHLHKSIQALQDNAVTGLSPQS